MFEHKHPLNLVDLLPEHEEEYEEDEENNEDLIPKQDFRCLCFRCGEEINWLHRYYYKCCECAYSIHKFCGELPERMEDICEVGHTLYLYQDNEFWKCNICDEGHEPHELRYKCDECYFHVDVNCATKRLLKNIIHHPSHIHPLNCINRPILCKCDACGKEHKGVFYCCTICFVSFIHKDCAFLPKMLQIQHTTSDIFSHIHPLTLAYSFPRKDQKSKQLPRCRVCRLDFYHNPNFWIYKCEKCRYYTHLDCTTSESAQFMSLVKAAGTGKLIKNYEDSKHPDLLHLPFPDASCSMPKKLFSNESGSTTFGSLNIVVTKLHDISHEHQLTLKHAPCTDITNSTSSIIKSVSYHDPMKRLELLCNGCMRPVTTAPIYTCDNHEDEHCNFVLHEWCSRLPTNLKGHLDHPEHTLILHTQFPVKFFGVFSCDICELPCNGFVYYCENCEYKIDINCAFLPKEFTHVLHQDHLLSRIYNTCYSTSYCRMCYENFQPGQFSFICYDCSFRIHPECALLIPGITTHKCDKHPMKLSYFPVENHNSEYFCEICEEELHPEFPFYHCHECMQSIHPACAPAILQYEMHCDSYSHIKAIHKFLNVKFGETYKNFALHPHPLSFVQGIASDGNCTKCGEKLQYQMIFKCLNCKFAVDIKCCEKLSMVFY